MKVFLSIFIILVYSNSCIAQTVSDVLEASIRVKDGQSIFLREAGKKIEYSVARGTADTSNPLSFTVLDDSLFLGSKNSTNIYLLPVNPLNFSYSSETKIILDPISEAESTALNTIIDVLSTTQTKKPAPGPVGSTALITVFDTCAGFKAIESTLKSTQQLLQLDQKAAIKEAFEALKALTFKEELSTLNDLDEVEKSMRAINDHFNKIDSLSDIAEKLILRYQCDKINGFLTQALFSIIYKDLKATAEEQRKRQKNLRTCYDLVREAQKRAAEGDGVVGLRWCLKLTSANSPAGKNSIFTVLVFKNGYELSNKGEIVATAKELISKKSLIIRKFQLFVPEISAGAAYTFFNYPTYGVTKNVDGVTVIADPVKYFVRNINITTMINWNLYSPNSLIHFLFQTGTGISSEIPIFLIGGGVRIASSLKTRLRITGGLAFTFIKDLDKLKVGDAVSGTADINSDLKYQFSIWGSKNVPKAYVGLQYNF